MATATRTIIDLRATVAMRICASPGSTREEAGARTSTPPVVVAYQGALAWEATCAERARLARVELIAAQSGVA